MGRARSLRAGRAVTRRLLAPIALAGALAAPSVASATVSNPVVSGPISGGLHGRPWFAPPFDLGGYGHTESEYFFSGTARAWGSTAAPRRYVMRMLVVRPRRARDFSGNVVVEWDNVTAQLDAPVEFMWMYPQVIDDGDAYVEVTVQPAGVCGLGQTGAAGSVCTPFSLKGWDPWRYGPLLDPGEAYSDDIFSQAAQAVRHPRGIKPLGPLKVRRMFAAGESQSAAELDDYI